MIKPSTSKLTAQKLQVLLIVSILLLLVAAGAIFFSARNIISGYAADVKRSTEIAELSDKNLVTLTSLKTKLADDKEDVDRAANLVAESQSYAYQDQIIKDLNTFAAKSGIGISSYQFNSEPGAGASGTNTPPAAAAAPGVASITPAISGLKTVSTSIELKSPLKYESAMEFVHMIEKNLTKMQLTGISLTKDPSSNNVTVSSLNIEVYVK